MHYRTIDFKYNEGDRERDPYLLGHESMVALENRALDVHFGRFVEKCGNMGQEEDHANFVERFLDYLQEFGYEYVVVVDYTYIVPTAREF